MERSLRELLVLSIQIRSKTVLEGQIRKPNKNSELLILFDEDSLTESERRSNRPVVRSVGGQCAISKFGGRSKRRETTLMKAVKFALAAILASGGVLSAQEVGTPRYEVGLNYSWLHVNSANADRQRTGNGGSGSFAYNINNVVGLVADFGGYANNKDNDQPLTFLVGPRFSWRHT